MRKKEEKAEYRGCKVFQGFPRKEFLKRGGWLFPSLSKYQRANNTVAFSPVAGVESLPRISTDYKSSSPPVISGIRDSGFRGFRMRDFSKETTILLDSGFFFFSLGWRDDRGHDISVSLTIVVHHCW